MVKKNLRESNLSTPNSQTPKNKISLREETDPTLMKQEEDLGQELTRKWYEEIEAIQQQEFSSLEEAIALIAERVVAKMDLEDSLKEQTLDFLEDLMITDPMVVEHLEDSLKIAKK